MMKMLELLRDNLLKVVSVWSCLHWKKIITEVKICVLACVMLILEKMYFCQVI